MELRAASHIFNISPLSKQCCLRPIQAIQDGDRGAQFPYSVSSDGVRRWRRDIIGSLIYGI